MIYYLHTAILLHREIGYEEVDLIQLAKGMVWWWAFVKIVMKIYIS
jgi:hypothetical protein